MSGVVCVNDIRNVVWDRGIARGHVLYLGLGREVGGGRGLGMYRSVAVGAVIARVLVVGMGRRRGRCNGMGEP